MAAPEDDDTWEPAAEPAPGPTSHRLVTRRSVWPLVVVGVVVFALVATVATLFATQPRSESAPPRDTDAPAWWVVPTPTATAATPAPGGSGSLSATASRTSARPSARTSGATVTTPPSFTPVNVQAEHASVERTNGAAIISCATCDGGYRVGYISGAAQVVVRFTAAVAGSRTVTVIYETDGPRTLRVSANGAVILDRSVDGQGWQTPQTLRFTAAIPAGAVVLALYNDSGPAPDVDRVEVS